MDTGQGKEMQEDTGQQFTFTGRWRGRKLWVLACTASLAAVLILLLVWVLPSSQANDEQAAQAGQETTQPASGQETESGHPQEPDAQAGGPGPTLTPGEEENAPGIVIDFPDLSGDTPEAPPPGGYEDIYGRWVLDMTGSAYGLTNCHIFLEENGTISSPPDYSQVFEIAASSYTWGDGNPSFSASLQLMLKMASSQVLIPVQIELAGTVSDSLVEIYGDFTATPQGEPYAPYGQQGTFRMHR